MVIADLLGEQASKLAAELGEDKALAQARPLQSHLSDTSGQRRSGSRPDRALTCFQSSCFRSSRVQSSRFKSSPFQPLVPHPAGVRRDEGGRH